jgi:hypothetical protein
MLIKNGLFPYLIFDFYYTTTYYYHYYFLTCYSSILKLLTFNDKKRFLPSSRIIYTVKLLSCPSSIILDIKRPELKRQDASDFDLQ